MTKGYKLLLKHGIKEGFKIGICAQIERSDGRILLVKRSASDTGAGVWEMPGGAVKSGERIEQALQREIEEETGLKVLSERLKYKTYFDFHDPEKNKHKRKFCFVVLAEGEPKVSEDHSELKWFTKEEIHLMKVEGSTNDFEIWRDHYDTLLKR